jgi:hypothetical protein
LGECQILLHNFILHAQSPDLWEWQPYPFRGYSVRGAYQQFDPLNAAEDLIWDKQVPLKVSTLIWQFVASLVHKLSHVLPDAVA